MNALRHPLPYVCHCAECGSGGTLRLPLEPLGRVRADEHVHEQATAGGRLGADTKARLDEAREQLGISQEVAERVINRISNQRVSSNLQVRQASSGLRS